MRAHFMLVLTPDEDRPAEYSYLLRGREGLVALSPAAARGQLHWLQAGVVA